MIEGDSKPRRVSYKWKPVELMGDGAEDYDFQEIDSLQHQWLQVKQEVESSTPEAYRAFTDRLTRRWAIETGIIEGVYELDRSVAETLVREGIAADYIERGSTNKEPSELVQILKDHQDSIVSVNYWIEQNRPLTKTFIRSLHTQILSSQDTHTAVNQFGNRFEATLIKGEFKNQPNNPTRPDGTVHEYCPPEQVESELDNLLEMYELCDEEGYHPLLLAAWLHHRFEQIHPFHDGNGRVGRTILTWHLVKKGFFPVVISRDDRSKYINALEKADAGDLAALIDLFVRLEKHTILQALDEGETETRLSPEPQVDLIGQVVGGIVERAKRRRLSAAEQMRAVNDTALALRKTAAEYLEVKSREVQSSLEAGEILIEPMVSEGGPDKLNERWYHNQALKTAKASQHRVNLNESRYFVRLALNPPVRGDMPRLIFVISVHHTGRRLSGIMAATAFAEIEYYGREVSNDSAQTTGSSDSSNFHNCAVNPCTFTWNDSAEVINDRFIRWAEECFVVALRYWMDNS